MRRGRAGRLGCGLLGGKVSGDCGQFRVGPRPECLADAQVELVPVQPSLHERGLEYADYLLAVGARGSQVASRPDCHLVPRRCHRWRLP